MQPEPTTGSPQPWLTGKQGIQEKWAGTVHAWLLGRHQTHTVVKRPAQTLAPTRVPLAERVCVPLAEASQCTEMKGPRHAESKRWALLCLWGPEQNFQSLVGPSEVKAVSPVL